MTDALKERVLEAAGKGYLTDAQIIAVVHELTRSPGTRSPEDAGIAELMQLIELARTGVLDEADNEHQEITSYHRVARSA
jgi:hypothetical protein